MSTTLHDAEDALREQLPPHSLEAERAVLGSLLLEGDRLPDVARQLTPSSFFKEGHRLIFAAMLALHAPQSPIDLLTVREALRSRDELEEAGGNTVLAGLADEATAAVHLSAYCTIVAEMAVRRDLIKLGAKIIGDSYDTTDSRALLDAAAEGIRDLEAARRASVGAGPTVIDWAGGRALYERPVRSVAHLVEGILPVAGAVVLTGEDKAGKSTLGSLLVLCYLHGAPFLAHAVARPGRAIIVSEEDDADELRDRLRAIHQGLAGAHPTLVAPPDDPASLALVEDRLIWEARAGVRLDDPALIDSLVAQITALCAREVGGSPVLVFIDSLQAVRGLLDPLTPAGIGVVKQALRQLMAAGAVVLLVAHARKVVSGGKRTARASQEAAANHELAADVAATLGLMTIGPQADAPVRADLVTKRGKSQVLGYLRITYAPETWPPEMITVALDDAPTGDARAEATDAKVLRALPVASAGEPGIPVEEVRTRTKLAEKTVRRSLGRLETAGRCLVTGLTTKKAKLYARTINADA